MSYGSFVIAVKDIKSLVRSPRFYVSTLFSGAGILFFWFIGFPGWEWNPTAFLRIIFTISLPCMGGAILFSVSDLISREREKGTITILLTQPVSDLSIVLGKFISALFCAITFATFNSLALASYYYSDVGEFLPFSTGTLLFLSFVLFQLAVIGLALPLSTLIKRSIAVPLAVIIIYFAIAALYSFATVSTMAASPDAPWEIRVIIERPEVFILSILAFGLIGLEFLISIQRFMRGLVIITEPEVIKYMPINVDAQRIFYYLLGTDQELVGLVGLSEAFLSGLALIATLLLGIISSTKLMRKVSAEA